VDVWQHAALRDGDSRHELVQLLVVSHRKLDMAGDDPETIRNAKRYNYFFLKWGTTLTSHPVQPVGWKVEESDK